MSTSLLEVLPLEHVTAWQHHKMDNGRCSVCQAHIYRGGDSLFVAKPPGEMLSKYMPGTYLQGRFFICGQATRRDAFQINPSYSSRRPLVNNNETWCRVGGALNGTSKCFSIYPRVTFSVWLAITATSVPWNDLKKNEVDHVERRRRKEMQACFVRPLLTPHP